MLARSEALGAYLGRIATAAQGVGVWAAGMRGVAQGDDSRVYTFPRGLRGAIFWRQKVFDDDVLGRRYVRAATKHRAARVLSISRVAISAIDDCPAIQNIPPIRHRWRGAARETCSAGEETEPKGKGRSVAHGHQGTSQTARHQAFCW
jgi:hypothetical protein